MSICDRVALRLNAARLDGRLILGILVLLACVLVPTHVDAAPTFRNGKATTHKANRRREHARVTKTPKKKIAGAVSPELLRQAKSDSLTVDKGDAERERMEHYFRWHHGRHVPIVENESADPKQVRTQGFEGALKYRAIFERDSSGKIDPFGRRKAIAQRNALLASQGMDPNKPLRDSLITNPIISSTQSNYNLSWTENGPFNVPGRTLSIAIHPTQTNKIWIGTADGGIWSTQNAGVTWTNVSDWLPSMAVATIVFDPNNPNTMYAGTGEGYLNGDAVQGAGLLQSKNGGVTFNLMPSTAGWQNVDAVLVAPGNSNSILAAVSGRGIEHSTDGGLTWSTTFASGGIPYTLVRNPSNASQILATGWDGGNNNYTILSTNGGLTWSPVSGIGSVSGWLSRITVAYAPSQPSTVYAVVANSGGGSQSATIWKSTNSGQAFTQVSTNANADWYSAPIWVDPTNPNIVVVGSVDSYRSTDGGQTFTQISIWYYWSIGGSTPHADMHAFVNDPNYNGSTNRKFYMATDGGVFMTNDLYNVTPYGGWSPTTIGVHSSQYYSADAEQSSGDMLGGLQDNGTTVNKLTNSAAFEEYGGDGGFVAIDPVQPLNHYGEYIDLEMFRSQDGGQSTEDLSGLIPDAGNAANFIAPFVLDPNNSNTLYAGGLSLWRSANITSASPSFTQSRAPGSDIICAIAVAKGDSNTVWVGQNNGVIAKTINATSANPIWSTVSVPTGGRAIGRIAIDPNNENHVYVGLGGFESGNILFTPDGGATWLTATGVSGSQLPAAPVMALVVDPSDSNYIYAGTEVGFFWTQDAGQHWSTANAGPSTAEVTDIRFVKNTSEKLIVATHGRGLWTTVVQVGDKAPIIVNPVLLTATPGGSVTYTIDAYDPDVPPTPFALTITSGPAFASLIGLQLTLNPPATQQIAQYPITLTATELGNNPPGRSSSVTFTIRVVDTSLSTLSFPVSSLVGGNTTTGTITLKSPAPKGGVTVALSSKDGHSTPPATVFIPEGSASQTFSLPTNVVSTKEFTYITAKYGSVSLQASILLLP